MVKLLDDKDQLDFWAESRTTREKQECAHPSGQPTTITSGILLLTRSSTSEVWDISYSKCHRDLTWQDFCSVISKAWKCAGVGTGFKGCKWQTHIPSLFQQDQVFSVDFQRLIDHYKIFTGSNGKWKGLWCCIVAKTGPGAGMERDYLLLEIWIL